MITDFDRRADGSLEIFDCRTGATIVILPRRLAWLEPALHRALRHL